MGLFQHEDSDSTYDDELEEYIEKLEELLGKKLEPGRGDAKCLRMTLDKVEMLHRSLTWYMSPAKRLTYWHRPHTSKTRLPILFIHGIGVGLYPYVNFLAELNAAGSADGDVGIIAVEILSVSSRITGPAMLKEEMC
ncbi:hypothetical protein J7337_008134 [Fusarium musae]|uniref:Uncharacterized protein n=1 Tax=Fusarium musae TaxID=1042133 RepID=A0A9P8DCY0_9HYPO|nr:hypothetical protein J7337_008134 [Fusarium musae]KAG9499675.1 hypothetical protein J7337_008134 [Fusarium musae]